MAKFVVSTNWSLCFSQCPLYQIIIGFIS